MTVPDTAALEKIIERVAMVAFERAATAALARLEKAVVPTELTSLRQRIGELDKLTAAIAAARATALTYALWGLAAFFGAMVLASVLGGAIVAALFRGSRRR